MPAGENQQHLEPKPAVLPAMTPGSFCLLSTKSSPMEKKNHTEKRGHIYVRKVPRAQNRARQSGSSIPVPLELCNRQHSSPEDGSAAARMEPGSSECFVLAVLTFRWAARKVKAVAVRT